MSRHFVSLLMRSVQCCYKKASPYPLQAVHARLLSRICRLSEPVLLVHALKLWRCYADGEEITLVTDRRPSNCLNN